MSLAGIWSGNLSQLQNGFGSGCCSKIFRSYATSIFENAVHSRRCRLQAITTGVGGRNHRPESNEPSNIDLKLFNKSVGPTTRTPIEQSGYEFVSVQYKKIARKVIDPRVIDWPAVVLVFDIETTGFSRKDGRIIEIAIRDLRGGKNSTFQTLVNPQKVIFNSDVHGITTRMVNRPGVPRMEDLIPILVQYARSRQESGKPVLWVAHNGRRFDVPFIVNEFKRCSAEVPSDWLFVDTLPLARQLVKPDGSKLTSVSLSSLKEFFDIKSERQAHRAMEDVNVLSSVLQKMSFMLKIDVEELMRGHFRGADVDKSSS